MGAGWAFKTGSAWGGNDSSTRLHTQKDLQVNSSPPFHRRLRSGGAVPRLTLYSERVSFGDGTPTLLRNGSAEAANPFQRGTGPPRGPALPWRGSAGLDGLRESRRGGEYSPPLQRYSIEADAKRLEDVRLHLWPRRSQLADRDRSPRRGKRAQMSGSARLTTTWNACAPAEGTRDAHTVLFI